MPINMDPPETHYATPPYTLLSFTFGLYCNKEWSAEEYEKWEQSAGAYQKYLDPYLPLPDTGQKDAVAERIINVEIPKNPPGESCRRNPTPAQAEAIWPVLLKELSQSVPASRPESSRWRTAYFSQERPLLSALACVYLRNADSVEDVVGMALDPKDGTPYAWLGTLTMLIGQRKSGASSEVLERLLTELRTPLLNELTYPPECW